MLCDNVPAVPVIVIVEVPGCAEPSAFSVRVLMPVVLDGLNAAVTPEGSPNVVRVTLLSSPFLGVTPILVAALLPCVTERLAAELDSRKSLSPAATGGRTS